MEFPLTRIGTGVFWSRWLLLKSNEKTLDEIRGINESHQAALYIDGDNVPQTVCRFAGNVFGADLVTVQTQHLHPGEISHVDRTAKAAQGEVCKMQELNECQTLQEKTISDAEIVKVTIIRSHLKLYMMLPTSGLCFAKNLKNDFSDH